MIKEKIISTRVRNKLHYFKKVGLGKIIINFIFQRIFRINSQIKNSVNYTSIFIGKNLKYKQYDTNIMVSFASSNSLYIQTLNGVNFGAGVLIASGVKIISANHTSNLKREAEECGPIIIEDDVWIGAAAIILPGVTIAKGSIVGAGAVVTKSFFKKGSVIAGNPAKLIKVINVQNEFK